MKNAGKACNNRLYRHIRTFEKIVKNYFVILEKSLTIFESPDEQDVNNRVIIISINKHTFLIAITS